jgi:hypothetical protein
VPCGRAPANGLNRARRTKTGRCAPVKEGRAGGEPRVQRRRGGMMMVSGRGGPAGESSWRVRARAGQCRCCTTSGGQSKRGDVAVRWGRRRKRGVVAPKKSLHWQSRWPRPTGRKGESGGEGPAAAQRGLHGAAGGCRDGGTYLWERRACGASGRRWP